MSLADDSMEQRQPLDPRATADVGNISKHKLHHQLDHQDSDLDYDDLQSAIKIHRMLNIVAICVSVLVFIWGVLLLISKREIEGLIGLAFIPQILVIAYNIWFLTMKLGH